MSATQQVTGLASGLDTGAIIKALMAARTTKVTTLENKISGHEVKTAAYNAVNTALLAYQNAVDTLVDKKAWSTYSASSTNEDSLTATVDEYVEAGSYIFEVLQLAQASQYTSFGFADANTTAVEPDGGGTIVVESAASLLRSETQLSTLNAGAGVDFGQFRITDKSGKSAILDLSGVSTIGGVIDRINANGEAGITASFAVNPNGTIDGTRLMLTDNSGGAGTMRVANYGGSTTASDLGIAGTDSASAGTLTGTAIYGLNRNTSLASLNDGLGVNNGKAGALTIMDSGGGYLWTVDLSDCGTVGSVLSAISAQTGGDVTATISADGSGLVLTGAAGANLSVSSDTLYDTTARDLGIACSNVGPGITGTKLIADMDSVQIKNLSGAGATGINGASADLTVNMGTFTLTDAALNDYNFNLLSVRSDDSLSDLIGVLNAQATAHFGEGALVFGLNQAGNGIAVTNHTGTALTATNGVGTTAADLGFTATALDNASTTDCGDLDRKWVSRATALSTLNNGEGISLGSIRVSDATGSSATLDLAECVTLGDVIDRINSSGLSIKASVNATGDGISIVESFDSGATGNIKVEEVRGGTTAAGLGILGTGTGGDTGVSSLTGSWETVIDVSANDTLQDIMFKITEKTNLSVSIVNDGSGATPYRLVIGTEETGVATNFVLTSTLDALNFRQTSKGQDSILLLGSAESGSQVMMRSATNTNNTAVQGMTLNLGSISDGPVTIKVALDKSGLSDLMQGVADSYTELVSLVNTLDQYVDKDTKVEDEEDISAAAGVLYCDSATRSLMNSLQDGWNTTRTDTGSIFSWWDLGFSMAGKGTVAFDAETFESLVSTRYNDIKSFISTTEDVASGNRGASVSGAKAAAGMDAQNLINGNTSSSDFGAANGFQADDTIANGANSVTVNFGGTVLLDRLTLTHINSSTMRAEDFGLRDFTVEYLDASTGKWEMLRTVEGNKAATTYVGFEKTTAVNSIRITATATNAADGIFRLVEIDAFSNTGAGNTMARALNEQTDKSTGYYAARTTHTDSLVTDLETQIEKLEARNASYEQMLWTKYTAMETTLARLNSQGNYLDSLMKSMLKKS